MDQNLITLVNAIKILIIVNVNYEIPSLVFKMIVDMVGKPLLKLRRF